MHPLDELQKMRAQELEEEFKKAKLELMKLKLGVASRQVKDTSKLKGLRKYVARIKTIKRFMEFESIKETPKSPVTK